MKKILLLSTFLVGSLLIFKPAEAQVRVHVNINPFPRVEHYDDWHRPHEVVVYNNDRDYRHDGYRDRRDFDNRDWRRNDDRYDDRRHDDNRDNNHYGRDDNRYGHDENRRNDDHRQHDDHGRGRW